jgi:hypothetical protein
MNPQSKIIVNFYGKDVNVKHQKDITEQVSKRMIENGCPEGATVGFYFDKIVVNKRLSGVYVSKVQAVNITVVVKHNGNESVKGNIKPGIYKDGTKMKMIELEGFLKPVITKKSIPAKGFDQMGETASLKPSSEQTTLPEIQTTVRVPYTQTEIMAPAFKDLFLEYLPTIFAESGRSALASRDIAPIFNESKTSFCESGKILGVRLLAILLGDLYRAGHLELANSGNPYAIYKLPSKKTNSSEEPCVKSLQVIEETRTQSNDIGNLEILLKKVKFTESLIQQQERDLGLLREQVSLGEENLNRLKLEMQTFQGELEGYRDLYRALNGVFG